MSFMSSFISPAYFDLLAHRGHGAWEHAYLANQAAADIHHSHPTKHHPVSMQNPLIHLSFFPDFTHMEHPIRIHDMTRLEMATSQVVTSWVDQQPHVMPQQGVIALDEACFAAIMPEKMGWNLCIDESFDVSWLAAARRDM